MDLVGLKRRHLRGRVERPCLLVLVYQGQEETVEAKTTDLSAGGVGLVCNRYVSQSAWAAFAIMLDDGLFRADIEIISRSRHPDGWRYGARFRKLDQSQQLRLSRHALRALAGVGEAPHA